MKQFGVRHFFIVLPLCGSLFIGQGVYIHAKAQLAQVLLEIAWFESKHVTDKEVKPWPWADTWPVSRLSVPALGIHRIVLAGVSGQALAFGPGHLFNSAMAGETGNIVLAGHRDTHFKFVKDLKHGEVIELQDREKITHRYEIVQTMVVHKDEILLPLETDERLLTLITCYPFNAISPNGPFRYIALARALS